MKDIKKMSGHIIYLVRERETAYTYRAQVHTFLLDNKFLSTKSKLCVRYYSFFHQMINLEKLCKMLFVSSKNYFSFSRHLNSA